MKRRLHLSRISTYIAAVAACSAVAMIAVWPARGAFPGIWGPFVLTLVNFLLEVTGTRLRGGGAEGSISFVIHLAAFLLFGPFWAAAIVAVSTLLSQLASKKLPTRIVFNTCQKAFSVALAGGTYLLAGGHVPPLYLTSGFSASFSPALWDVGAFLLAALVYFGVNSSLVSWAVGISTGRSGLEVWKTNTLWVLGYDVASSSIAVLVAWLYLVFDQPQGLTRFGFLAIFLPIIAAKHVYGKLNTLQSLYDELDSAHERLELNMREQLAMMVKSIEARDPYTSGHSKRVSVISKAVAIDFGLSEDLVAEVENAALLHDVGKIHAEFAPLLSKEGKLTPEEWEIMKTHATKSAELVGLFSRFGGFVQDSVRHHHERWDGLGYPDGIAGEQIPLGARIIMIADTVDAMTTDRPYRKALSFEVVISELTKHRGTQFDPRLVDCTINSVSVRRVTTSQEEATLEALRAKVGAKTPPLRSYGSFFTGRRLGSDRA